MPLPPPVNESSEAASAASVIDRVRGWEPTPTAATFAIVGTSFAYASTSIFVRQLTDSGMSVIAVAFFRFLLTAIVLFRFLNFSPLKRAATRWGLLSGMAMGAGWIVYVRTIDTADLAVAGVVQMTYPLFALVSGWFLFAARPTLRAAASGFLVVLAATVGLGLGTSGLSLLLFASPLSFGFSVSVLTERLGDLDPFERLASVAVGAAVAMSPLLLTLEWHQVLPTSVASVGWVLAIGAISALIPMLVYAAAAPIIGTARTAAAGAFELPTMFVLGAVLFGEAIRINHLGAAAIIVVAIGLTRSARSTHVVPDDDTDATRLLPHGGPGAGNPVGGKPVGQEAFGVSGGFGGSSAPRPGGQREMGSQVSALNRNAVSAGITGSSLSAERGP